MDAGQLGEVAGILVSVSFFAMIFGIVYLFKRERMAMIERGMDLRRVKRQTSVSYLTLKIGLLLIGSGIGLFLAYLLDYTVFAKVEDGSPAIYFALIAIFGGAGLFVSFLIEKKASDKVTEGQTGE